MVPTKKAETEKEMVTAKKVVEVEEVKTQTPKKVDTEHLAEVEEIRKQTPQKEFDDDDENSEAEEQLHGMGFFISMHYTQHVSLNKKRHNSLQQALLQAITR